MTYGQGEEGCVYCRHEQGGAGRLFLSRLALWLLAGEKWMWAGEHVWAWRGFERALARVSERSHCQPLVILLMEDLGA